MDTMILPALALNEPDFWRRQELLNGLFGIQSIGNQRMIVSTGLRIRVYRADSYNYRCSCFG